MPLPPSPQKSPARYYTQDNTWECRRHLEEGQLFPAFLFYSINPNQTQRLLSWVRFRVVTYFIPLFVVTYAAASSYQYPFEDDIPVRMCSTILGHRYIYHLEVMDKGVRVVEGILSTRLRLASTKKNKIAKA